MKIEGETLVFDSGRRIEHVAVCGVLGIGTDLQVHGGFDETIVSSTTYVPPRDALNGDEQRELADYAIRQWELFRERTPR